jgi:hypothetical protein
MAQELQVFCSRSECNKDESVKCVDCEYLVTEELDVERKEAEG